MKKELAKAVLDAKSACKEFKEAAQNYLNAAGTDNEGTAWDALVTEAKEDIIDIDHAIEFLKGDFAKQLFGAEFAAEKLAETEKAKANGEIYCGCEGCVAAKNIINY